MKTHFPSSAPSVAICLAFFAVWGLPGCGAKEAQKKTISEPDQVVADQHDEHAYHAEGEHPLPEDFASGVTELKEHYQEIKVAFAQDDLEKASQQAHAPLHGIGRLLEALPDLAKKANLPPEDSETVKKSVDTLFQAYGSVDDALHVGKEPDYKAVADQIDDAMAGIEAVQAKRAK